MKKLIVLLVAVLIASGCTSSPMEEKLYCESTTTSGNLTTKTSYDITYMDNDVKYTKIVYDYSEIVDTTEDGVGTGTDGTTEDDDTKNDGIVDGKVGDAILDLAGIRTMYTNRLNEYGEINGFKGIVDDNQKNKYKVTYEIDFTKISDDDLNKFNLSRNYDTLKKSLEDQGLTCK